MKKGALFNLTRQLAFFVAATGYVFAENRYPIAFALKTEEPIIVDGLLDEGCWVKALGIDSFVEAYDNKKVARVQTSFRVVYNNDNVYFGIQVQEPALSTSTLNKVARDVWVGENSIEIFLDVDCNRTTYYQLAADILCNQYDGYVLDKEWNADWNVGVKIGEDGWTMEIGIKFSDLKAPTPAKGSVWGLNICRNREGGACNSTTWAEVGGNFHNPAKFNTLIFGSGTDWWKREFACLERESDRLHKTLNRFEVHEKRLEQKLILCDDLRRKVSWQEKAEFPQETRNFLPVFNEVQSLKRMYQDIADEMEAISILRKTPELER